LAGLVDSLVEDAVCQLKPGFPSMLYVPFLPRPAIKVVHQGVAEHQGVWLRNVTSLSAAVQVPRDEIAVHYYCMSMYKTCGCSEVTSCSAFAARDDMSQDQVLSFETRCVTSPTGALESPRATPLREGSAALIKVSCLTSR
jgi:hypothetical protein